MERKFWTLYIRTKACLLKRYSYSFNNQQVIDLFNTIKISYPNLERITTDEKIDITERIDITGQLNDLMKHKLKNLLVVSTEPFTYWRGRLDQAKDTLLEDHNQR